MSWYIISACLSYQMVESHKGVNEQGVRDFFADSLHLLQTTDSSQTPTSPIIPFLQHIFQF